MKARLLSVFIWLIIGTSAAIAQTTSFTYQGSLNDGGSPANATYDMQFKLFDDPDPGEGNQIGATVTNPTVQVTNGSFTVQIDFTAMPFNGQELFLEISMRPAGSSGSYITLAPRQRLASSPYSILALNAGIAANSLQLGGVTANQFVLTGDPRLFDARNPLPGNGNYIQNRTSPQTTSNFNVSGTGTASILNAQMQFNIGGNRVLSVAGNVNTFVGINAGRSNAGGQGNSFFGNSAGDANTSGSNNAFFGAGAGFRNTTGSGNSFFGTSAGDANTTGGAKAYFGTVAGAGITTGSAN
jgi:hypothetical protein